MAGNGLNVAAGTADIDFSDGVDTYGFKLAVGSSLSETRGSAYAGQISSGGQTYQDAEPWKRKVYDNWLGGLGQISDNKVYGGTGIGGDDTKYFYADGRTDRAGYLLPGMARNLVYNTISGQMTPIADGLDPVAGDEYEVPRGVVPFGSPSGSSLFSDFTLTGIKTISNVRVLCLFRNVSASNVTISARLNDGASTYGVYSTTVSLTTATNYTGWKWVTLPKTSGTGTNTNNSVRFSVDTLDDVTFGGYINNSALGNITNHKIPYFQLMTSSTPSKWWASPAVKFEQLLNGTTYVNMAITTGAIFNTAATATGGTAGTSPERTLSGTTQSTVVFNNSLYVFSGAGVEVWTAAAAATNAASTSSTFAVQGWSPVAFGGFIFYISSSKLGIYKWDGAFPPVTNSQVVADNKIGQPGSPLNALFVYQGNLWVIKPEGLYQLYADPAIIDTNPGNTPRVIPVVADLPSAHRDTGKWYCIHQGMIYFNYRDSIYQVLPGLSGPPQVTVITLPVPWYRLSYYHYVNGITSDGVSLYVSWNNLGVFKYANQTWHPVTEFYEQVGVEGQSSGLRWLPNPAGGPNYLFVGDGKTIVQLPEPSVTSPYTSQVYQNHQNKCGYWISSATDMDQAEIVKYVQSVILRAVPSGYSYKLVAVAWQSSTTPSFKNLLERTWQDGLSRDNWMNPNVFGAQEFYAVTQKENTSGGPLPNTAAPTCWVASDFNNIFYSSEKAAATTTDTTANPPVTDVLTNPPKFVQTAFILYFWNPVAGQHATTGVDLMAIDSLVVKYQAVQDYLASYQCVIDFHLTVSGTGSNTNTTQQIEDAYEWLRSQTGRHSPLKATFRKRVTGDAAGKIKTVYFLPQNPGWISDPTLTALAGGDPGEPLIKTVSLQMVATTSEYANV